MNLKDMKIGASTVVTAISPQPMKKKDLEHLVETTKESIEAWEDALKKPITKELQKEFNFTNHEMLKAKIASNKKDLEKYLKQLKNL